MASDAAIEAVKQNECARRRLGNLQLCAFLKRHKLPVEWAEAGFGAVNCVCRENLVDSGEQGGCSVCNNTEAYYCDILFDLELMETGVWAHDEHMRLCPEDLIRGILLSSDKEWTAWRKSQKKEGFVRAEFLRNIQPLRTFLMESDARTLCTEPCAFRDMLLKITETLIQSAAKTVLGNRYTHLPPAPTSCAGD